MKKNIRYISILITILFIFVSFVGCSNEKLSEEITSDTITASAESEHTTTTVQASQLSQSQQTDREITTKKAKPDNKTSGTATASTTDQTTQKSATTKTAENKTTAAKTAKTTTTTTATTTSSTVLCSVEIECKKILSNMGNLKAGHEDFVPADGIIMSTKTVTVNNGSTAYDALKSACSKSGVTINAQNSAYGTYIAGFNNIDEFDCGRQSGWIYTVNGSSPPKSCDKYTVSQGDSIVFSFVC